MNNKIMIPFILTIVFSVLLGVTFFLPLASANEEYSKVISKFSSEKAMAGSDYTYGDLKDISMFKFAGIYKVGLSSKEVDDYGTAESTICFVLIILTAIFTVLTILFSVLKKPIPLLIFDVLTFGVFRLLMWDMGDRKVLPSSNYDIGIAGTLYYVCFVILAVAAIGLIIMKIQSEKQNTDQKV